MSADENKKIDKQFMETINSRDIALLVKLIDEIYAPDCVYHNPAFPNFGQGPEPQKQFHRQLSGIFPDLHIRLDDILAEGDKVVSHGMVTGTNATTGEPLKMNFIHISRYAEGKLVEEWELDVPEPLPHSPEENKKATMQWYEMTNTRDLSALDQLVDQIIAPDYVLHDPGFPDFGIGPEAMKATMHGIIQTFPDLHVAVEDVFAEGDKVACRCVITGTNAATAEPLNLQTLSITRFSEGKMVEDWGLEAPVLAPVKA